MFTATEPVRIDHSGVQTGGTLRLRGPGDPATLDPAALDDESSARLVRLYARQLFTYQPRTNLSDWQAIAPVPDLAAQIPSIYNAGLGASGTTYVVHLRQGVQWDTAVPRPVTAHDVIRGIKRLANPVRPASVLRYFTSTIRGMAAFHADFAAAVGTDPTAAALADFQNNHEIPGVFALDDESLVFELVRPVRDFITILALPAVAPAAVEYDAFLPDSPQLRANLRSTGPYRVTRYVAGRELVLEPNPVWRQETDPIRRQYLDRIEVGLDGPADPAELAREIDTGAIDLAWNTPVPQPYSTRPADPDTGLGFRLDPCLVFNLRRAALRDVAVRRAIAYAIDRSAVAEAVVGLGTGTAVRVANGVVPPNNDGHTGADPHSTPLPDRARELLAEAGHTDGLTLTAVHTDTPEAADVARSYATDLERVGITVRLVALSPQAHRELIADPAGEWDLTTMSWSPSWQHDNNRVFLQRLFQGGATGNHGGYHAPEVDDLIERALDTIDPRPANAIWQQVERRVLDDVPVVPLLFQIPARPRLQGSRVRDAVAMPSLGYEYDLATIWLDTAGGWPGGSGRCSSRRAGEPENRTLL
jgi:peptide/nickel transport system substrate-binding protein